MEVPPAVLLGTPASSPACSSLWKPYRRPAGARAVTAAPSARVSGVPFSQDLSFESIKIPALESPVSIPRTLPHPDYFLCVLLILTRNHLPLLSLGVSVTRLFVKFSSIPFAGLLWHLPFILVFLFVLSNLSKA